MDAAPAQACPRCGSADTKPIAKRYDYPVGMGAWNSKPESTTYTYQCQCGVAFTHTVRIPPAASGKKESPRGKSKSE
jgi:hypothetical protein